MKSDFFVIALTFMAILGLCFLSACQRSQPKADNSPGWGKVIRNPSLSDHQEQTQKWRSKRPQHYRYKLRYQCYCSWATFYQNNLDLHTKVPRWVILEVLDGRTISAKDIDASENTRYLYLAQFDGVEMIERGLQRMESNIREGFKANYALYDVEYGFPRYLANKGEEHRMHVDYEFEIIEFEDWSARENAIR